MLIRLDKYIKDELNDAGSPRLPEGGVINCNGNGILNQNQVTKRLEESESKKDITITCIS